MRLFLYGTLQPAADSRMARWLMPRIQDAHAATVPGRLLAIAARDGWYPALVRGAAGERCHGTLADVALGPGDLARLDRYEGREYRRTVLRARAGDATSAAATVYLWRGSLPPSGAAIRGGDFLAWLQRTGRRSFTSPRAGG